MSGGRDGEVISRGNEALSLCEVRILNALIAAFYGEGERGDGLPARVDQTDALARALRYVGAMRFPERLVVRVALRSLDFAGLRHGRRFHKLSAEHRVDCLARLANSPWYPRRVQYLFLKTLCLMSVYSTAPAHAAMGYRPEGCLADLAGAREP